MTNRQFIVLACRVMSVLTFVRLPWFVFENMQTLFRLASWPDTKSPTVHELIDQTTPIVIGVWLFELLAAIVLWRFADVIALYLARHNADEPMARVASLSVVDVQSLIFVGIGAWMLVGALFQLVLTCWLLAFHYIKPSVGSIAQLLPDWLSLSYQLIYILGGVALIVFARPLAQFTQRERRET